MSRGDADGRVLKTVDLRTVLETWDPTGGAIVSYVALAGQGRSGHRCGVHRHRVALTLIAQLYLVLRDPGKSFAVARNQPRALV